MAILKHRQELGSGILDSLGLNKSIIPKALLQLLAVRLDKLYFSNIRIVTSNKSCKGLNLEDNPRDHACCHLNDPRISSAVSQSVDVSIGFLGSSLSLTGRISITPGQPAFDRDSVCPGEKCADEEAELMVPFSFEFALAISGAVSLPSTGSTIDLGPVLNSAPVSTAAGAHALAGTFSVNLNKTIPREYEYRVTCKSIYPKEMELLAHTPARAITTSDRFGRTRATSNRSDCEVEVTLIRIIAVGASVDNHWTLDFGVNGLRTTILGKFDSAGKFVQASPITESKLYHGFLLDKCKNAVVLPISVVGIEQLNSGGSKYTSASWNSSFSCVSTTTRTQTVNLRIQATSPTGSVVNGTARLRLKRRCVTVT